MLVPESAELAESVLTKCHLQPLDMLTYLHSMPSRQGIVGTDICSDPPLTAALSCRNLKQARQCTVICRAFGETLVSVDLQAQHLQPQGWLRNMQLGPYLQGIVLGVSFKLVINTLQLTYLHSIDFAALLPRIRWPIRACSWGPPYTCPWLGQHLVRPAGRTMILPSQCLFPFGPLGSNRWGSRL